MNDDPYLKIYVSGTIQDDDVKITNIKHPIKQFFNSIVSGWFVKTEGVKPTDKYKISKLIDKYTHTEPNPPDIIVDLDSINCILKDNIDVYYEFSEISINSMESQIIFIILGGNETNSKQYLYYVSNEEKQGRKMAIKWVGSDLKYAPNITHLVENRNKYAISTQNYFTFIGGNITKEKVLEDFD